MKFIIKENQFDKFVEVMLNREMPSKFDWWKNIKVIEFSLCTKIELFIC